MRNETPKLSQLCVNRVACAVFAAVPRGDGSFGGFAECCGHRCPHAKLAVHEEFPDQVAATIKKFLLAA